MRPRNKTIDGLYSAYSALGLKRAELIVLLRCLYSRLWRKWLVRVAMLLLLGFQWSAAQLSVSSAADPLVLPSGLVFDGSGNLFFAEAGRHQVRRLTPPGVLTVVAGTGVQGFSGDGGPASAAMLDSPTAVAVDAMGRLLIADSHNGRIRRVDSVTGVISTIARVRMPVALAFDRAGNLVYADAALHQVLRVESSGAQTIVAGSGVQGTVGDGGEAISAALDSPSGLAFDGTGNLFIADSRNNAVRRVDAATGLITTLAVSARLRLPRGLIVDASGDLYIVDAGNQRIRRVDAITGAVTSIAGTGVQGFSVDSGAAVGAELDSPQAVGLSGQGAVAFSDSANGRVRQVDGSGKLQTIAGVGAALVTAAKVKTVTGILQTGAVIQVGVSSSAGGVPTGSVSMLDAGIVFSSAPLAHGAVSFSTLGLSAGSHTLQALYSGDASFAGSISAAFLLTIGDPAPGDFALTSGGSGSASVLAGNAASFGFMVTPTGAPLVSRIVLSVTGLPVGASATFAPGFVPPPSGPVAFTLAVQTVVRAAGAGSDGGLIWAGLLGGLLLCRRRRRVGLLALAILLVGCGDRVNTGSAVGRAPVSYNLVVTATGTSASGAALVHTVPVVLTVE